MSRLTLTVILIALLAAAGGPAAAQSRPSIPLLTSEEVARLEADEILVEIVPGDLTEAMVVGLVDTRPAELARLLRDFDRMRLLVPAFRESEDVGAEGSFRLHRGELETPWPMEPRVFTFRTWQGETEVDGRRVWMSAFDYVPASGNLSDCFGHWLLVPWEGGRTLVLFEVSVDLGTWLPSAVERWAARELFPSLIQGLRGQIARQS